MENLTITIKNAASFNEEGETLELEKQHTTLVYGLNGTGKTTISNFLQFKEEQEEQYEDCSLEGFDPNNQKILVYNRKFIEENFYEHDTQKGIFNLSTDNKEALENINTAENRKTTLETQKIEQNEKLEEQEALINEKTNETTETVWEIKTTYARDGNVFNDEGFLDGLKGSQESLFKHLLGIKLQEPTKTIEEIKQELQDLSGDNGVERDTLNPIANSIITQLSDIEKHNLLQEEIIGKQNSSVSELITRLKNSDWVKQGLDNYVKLKQSRQCPFCQEETLTGELIDKIKEYFDDSYKQKVETVKDLKESYESFKNNLSSDDYKKEFFTAEQKQEFENLFNNLSHILKTNLSKIESKIKQLSKTVSLQSSTDILQEINTWIEERNKEIDAFNKKLLNIKQTTENLKTEFWKIQRKKYDTTIKAYKKAESKFTKEKEKIEQEVSRITNAIYAQNTIIANNQKNVSNIDKTIAAINNHLEDFGIEEFNIVKHKDQYKIQRGKDNDKVFQSLSEGEKTVISFLYFIELCKGRESKQDTKEKIIVIDDPISSLSHIYVFNVAQLIKSTFIDADGKNKNSFSPHLILTHNLYFFHELKRILKKKNVNMFRITKIKNNCSKIREMNENEILNNYQEYWKIIKNANEANKACVANAMRNILEHFFGFLENETLHTALEKLDSKYAAFERYMDRESHSDRENITDDEELNIKLFTKPFKEVFEKAGYIKHYKAYMNKEQNNTEANN